MIVLTNLKVAMSFAGLLTSTLALLLPGYLLCDNKLPLEYINCSYSNSTLETGGDFVPVDVKVDNIIRLSGLLAIGVFMLVIVCTLYKGARISRH